MERAPGRKLDILLVHGKGLVREALLTLLEKDPGIGKVHAVSSREAAERIAEEPAVIIVEPLSIGAGMDAAGLVASLLSRFPASQILVLTNSDALTDVRRCLAAGARGYMLKKGSGTDLSEAVRKVAKGEEYLQPALGALLAKSTWEANRQGKGLLNKTETDVLRHLALGYTNAEVARILSFGVRTIEGYRARLMNKLGVSTRAELVRAAVSMGLLYPTELDGRRNGQGSHAVGRGSQALS